jgi:hypothetical protein
VRVRLIGGFREGDPKDPLMGLELQAVAFPMSVVNYDATGPSDPEEITLNSETELIDWANSAFDETGYEIFTIEIQQAPMPTDIQMFPNDPGKLLDLITAKKTEYEDSAPSTPEAGAEREAVVAALETLEIHARDVLNGVNPLNTLGNLNPTTPAAG